MDFTRLPEAFVRRMEVSAVTSRGCSFRCRFCHEYRFWRGQVRSHAPERVLRELTVLAERYDNHLRGVDDSMLDMSSPYFFRLLELLGPSGLLPPDFGFLTRLDTINHEGLAAMKRAGIHNLSVGAESGSQVVLDAMGKGLRVEQIAQAMGMARDTGVATNGFFILGHPGDSPEQAAVSRDFVERCFQQELLNWTDLSIFTPYPGTPYFAAPERYGVELLGRDWSLWRRSNRPIAQLAGYSAGEIYLDYLRLLQVQARYRGSAS